MRHAPRHRRRGLALVEVLLALTLVAVGLLALVGTSARVTWLAGRAQADAAVSAAADRFAESLRARPCAELVEGDTTDAGVTVRWTVAASGELQRIAVEAVRPTAPRRAVLRAVVRQCPAEGP